MTDVKLSSELTGSLRKLEVQISSVLGGGGGVRGLRVCVGGGEGVEGVWGGVRTVELSVQV